MVLVLSLFGSAVCEWLPTKEKYEYSIDAADREIATTIQRDKDKLFYR